MSPVLDIVTITKSDTSVLPTNIGIDDLKRLDTMTAKKATTITKKMKEPNMEQTEIKNSLIIIETTLTITVTKRHQTIKKSKYYGEVPTFFVELYEIHTYQQPLPNYHYPYHITLNNNQLVIITIIIIFPPVIITLYQSIIYL